MSITLAAGVTLIDFLNKSLETLKLVQQENPNSNEMQLHLATLTKQLSLTMVEAAQLQGLLAQKNEEIRQLKQALEQQVNIQYDSESELYWADGDNSPYCPVCYESDSKLIHLVCTAFVKNQQDYPLHLCKVCGNKFHNGLKERI
ncbi:Uncharacterised protein [Vibrio cholerae]|uniref:hypothetical protein n=1 Tax=Vibrio TaxID=662 RepID=UPI0005B3ECF4|nr:MULTISPECIES: hypothetical protein [Vibrio]EGR0377012.1 hypothetical protein [Vibrio cholerae]EGR5155579.1 hypothetical protein [Vibrio cholerae]EIC9845382.1 hypothetical protein [Vibrio cholerae]EJL6300107.1 hypothetical protein [Vibrio cholerae]EJL6467394.1 hypothetical protein [Vibrio cholerae]